MVIPEHRLGAVRVWNRRAAARGDGPVHAAVVGLASGRATEVELVGAKAANLARAAIVGLPVLPGFVVPVAAVEDARTRGGFGSLPPEMLDELHAAWSAFTDDGSRPAVARSSAVNEDGEASSMAGRFHTALDITGWRAFLTALDEVAESATVIALDEGGATEQHEMAILVQPFLRAAVGGVLFGVDPVSGRRDRIALASVTGGPDALVSGTVSGAHALLSRRGRVLDRSGDDGPRIRRSDRRRLVGLARRAELAFGSPQDIEWAIDERGELWLLQARPVTTVAATDAGAGPVFGPGPVAETFPDPLSELEQQLWLDPLRAGMEHAIELTGMVSRRQLQRSPVVVAVGGRAAVDLQLIGAFAGERRSVLHALDPRPRARRLRAAWRTGRLRRAVPGLAGSLLARVDSELAGVRALDTLSDDALVALLQASRRILVALHGQEILTGLLLHGSAATAEGGGAALALDALGRARRAGVAEDEIIERYPAVLALVAPAVRERTLPPAWHAPATTTAGAAAQGGAPDEDEIAVLREQLRLRARWVHELSARAAWQAGVRLAARGVIACAADVRDLDLPTMAAALGGAPSQPLAPGRGAATATPLPSAFRLDGRGRVVEVRTRQRDAGRDGQGAGGGRMSGRVVFDATTVEPGEKVVLVTQSLSPALAAQLPALAGLIAETGSVLSHLAILARECGIATVVNVANARQRFAAGDLVVVDGSSGTIDVIEHNTVAADHAQ